MPNPKWEVYENKATGIEYDLTDADAQRQLSLIKDGTDIDSFDDVETALATKVDNVAGKGLSTNDYDNTEKAKVAGAFPRSEQAVLGAWNMLNTPYVDNGRTIGTVTLVEGTGGTISFSGGVASTTCDFVLHRRALDEPHPLYLPYGKYKYKLNSSASGFSILVGTTYNGAYKDIGGTWTTGEYIFEINANTQSDFKLSDGSVLCSPHIGVAQGTDTTDIVLKPTIELIEAPTDFIPPYAMTNKQLTDAVAVKNGLTSVTVIEGATLSANDSFLRKQNNVISAQLRVNGVTANSGENIATIPSGFIPSLTGGTVVFMSNASTGEMIPAYITINGYVRARTNLSAVDVNINFTYIAP